MASADVAPPPGLVVEWEAPSDCPDAEQVRGTVWAALGSARSSRSARITARAVVTPAPGGFAMRLAIVTEGVSETKTVDAESCATLADAYAVIVAFRFDPEAAAKAPAHVAPTASPPEPAGPVSRPRVLRLGAGPVFATSAGVLPFPAFGIGAAVEAVYGLRWSLDATYWPRTTWASNNPAYGEAVQLVSAQPSACVPVAGGAIAFCGGAEVGAMIARGQGIGVVHSNDGISFWLAFTAGVEFELPLARFVALRIRLDGGVPVFFRDFTVVNAPDTTVSYQPGPGFALLRLEPLFRFFSTGSAETRHLLR